MRLPILAFLLFLCTCVSAQKIDQADTPRKIVIRSSASVANSSEPLVIIDGHILEAGSINELDPNNIESISVHKDESAIAIYGTRGKNGVIVVATKDGNYIRPNYTLTPEEIPADIFTRYAELEFGSGKEVVYLLDGKLQRLKKLRKLDTTTIESIKVYEGSEKANRLGQTGKNMVVSVKLH
jgi:TonB-dependent SusC/RagA subfamily outer membrane receptor